jgi:hypothetical protein
VPEEREPSPTSKDAGAKQVKAVDAINEGAGVALGPRQLLEIEEEAEAEKRFIRHEERRRRLKRGFLVGVYSLDAGEAGIFV